MRALAEAGEPEGSWLRADRQTGGKGRRGRTWVSPEGNLHASTLVRLREGDPPAPTLALVAAVALHDATNLALDRPSPLWGGQGGGPPASAGREVSLSASHAARAPHPTIGPAGSSPGRTQEQVRSHKGGGGSPSLLIKWPNDLLLDGKKLAGILLERVDDAVIIGFGVNLARAPGNLDRPATSLATHVDAPVPDVFLPDLADSFARWLGIWRDEGLSAIRAAWLDRAHPIGTALSIDAGDGHHLSCAFDGLTPEGALILRLENARTQIIHAGDVFLFDD